MNEAYKTNSLPNKLLIMFNLVSASSRSRRIKYVIYNCFYPKTYFSKKKMFVSALPTLCYFSRRRRPWQRNTQRDGGHDTGRPPPGRYLPLGTPSSPLMTVAAGERSNRDRAATAMTLAAVHRGPMRYINCQASGSSHHSSRSRRTKP